MESLKANDFVNRLLADLRRDKKKTVLLSVLLLVAGVMGGRLIVARAAPQRAGASMAMLPAAGGENAAAPAGAAASPRLADGRKEEYLAKLDRNIARDLFRPELGFFPVPHGNADPQAGEDAPDSGWFWQIQQMLSAGEDARRKQQAKADTIQQQAKTVLDLQTTMLGSSPAAMINGKLLRVGEVVNGFVLKSVGSNSCVVTKDGVEAELMMKG